MSNIGNKKTFSNNLKFYIDKSNKSRKEIAKDINVPYSTFTYWCNGKIYPRIDKIEILANYFGIEKSDLIEERDKIDKTIGIKTKLLRESNHLTRLELSRELGISVDELSWYEEGWREIPQTLLQSVADYFKVALEDLTSSELTFNNSSALFISANPKLVELHKIWSEQVGEFDWTEEEYKELINYAKYIKSKR